MQAHVAFISMYEEGNTTDLNHSHEVRDTVTDLASPEGGILLDFNLSFVILKILHYFQFVFIAFHCIATFIGKERP